jgi:hypothetical protein
VKSSFSNDKFVKFIELNFGNFQIKNSEISISTENLHPLQSFCTQIKMEFYPCYFPFEYDKQTYSSCISYSSANPDDSYLGDEWRWCAITANLNDDNLWGPCEVCEDEKPWNSMEVIIRPLVSSMRWYGPINNIKSSIMNTIYVPTPEGSSSRLQESILILLDDKSITQSYPDPGFFEMPITRQTLSSENVPKIFLDSDLASTGLYCFEDTMTWISGINTFYLLFICI